MLQLLDRRSVIEGQQERLIKFLLDMLKEAKKQPARRDFPKGTRLFQIFFL